jgi:hypothetical protein
MLTEDITGDQVTLLVGMNYYIKLLVDVCTY